MCAMALSRYSLRWIIFRPLDQQHEYQHRHQEWLDFLKKISRETPKHLQLHSIVDNYTTHKYTQVKAWLEKHERFHMHFTPTSSSWMNMIERLFGDITVYVRDGSFGSVRELKASMTTFFGASICATVTV